MGITQNRRMKWKNRNATGQCAHTLFLSSGSAVFTVVIPRRKEADECPQLRGGTIQENICNVDAIHLVAVVPLHIQGS